MNKILSVAFFLMFLQASAQKVEQDKNFDKIIPGLSENNVRDIVGVPARVEPFITVTAKNDTNIYWVYNNLYTIVFKNHYVDYVEKNRIQFLNNVQQWNDPKNTTGLRLIYGHQ